jgi:hypothetical protein
MVGLTSVKSGWHEARKLRCRLESVQSDNYLLQLSQCTLANSVKSANCGAGNGFETIQSTANSANCGGCDGGHFLRLR